MPSLPLGASASLYGKLGFYLANTEQTNTTVASGATCCVRVGSSGSSAEESNLGLTFGLGLAWNFTRNLAARADWQRYPAVGGDRVREVDVDMLHAGLLYRF
jgi:opacity protein-like surface antigen